MVIKMSLEYKQEKEKLSLVINSIIRNFNSHKNMRDLINALHNALALAENMHPEEGLTYLAGLNNAFGDPEKIAAWQKNPEFLVETYDNLAFFLVKHYPKDKRPASEIRAKVLEELLTCALLLLMIVTITLLASTTGIALAISLIASAIFLGFLFADPDARNDSRAGLLLNGESRQDKVNTSILQKFTLFSREAVEDSEKHEVNPLLYIGQTDWG